MADDLEKKKHSSTLSALLCIAHVLPLACKSERIMGRIFIEYTGPWGYSKNFHAEWRLGGWNDGIIQPARDAVLNYYKVRAPVSHLIVLALKAIEPNSIYSLNQLFAEPTDLRRYMRLNKLS